MSIRSRGKSVWEIKLYVGKGPNGKDLLAYHTFHGGKREAEKEERRLKRELDLGSYSIPTKLTVAEYLDRWLRDYAKPNVAGTTLEGYTRIVERYVKPRLGSVKLARLRPAQIQALYSTLQDQEKGLGLSGHTALKVHRLLHQGLAQAVFWRELAVNPAAAVKPPRRHRKEMQALSEQETARLLAGLSGTKYHAPVLVAVTCGLRRGELLGLRWKDLDLEAQPARLAVHQALEQTKEGLRFKEPKTDRSLREITLPQAAVASLRRHRAEQNAARLEQGNCYHDHDLVFPAPDGRPWSPSGFSRMFHHHAHRLGFTCRLHDLRHSHATQLLRQGTDVKTISTRLGHSSTSFTLDTYVHALRGPDEEAAARLDQALEDAIQEVATAKNRGKTGANRNRRRKSSAKPRVEHGHLQEV